MFYSNSKVLESVTLLELTASYWVKNNSCNRAASLQSLSPDSTQRSECMATCHCDVADTAKLVTFICTKTPCTVDLEIFVFKNFRILNFRIKIFSWSWIPTNIFLTVLIGSAFPGLVIWNETAHAKKTWSTNSLRAAFVATIQLLANYYGCKREPNDAVGTYCASKDR